MKKIILLFVVLTLYGCSIFARNVPVRLYELNSGKVIQAEFIFAGTTQGDISFTFPSGEKWTGEYQTTRGGSVSSESIYCNVWGNKYNSSFYANGETTTEPTEWSGVAFATSTNGRSITCEYITSKSIFAPHGNGVCKDNLGVIYKLMF
jgi:hypothetical protein